MLKRHIKASFWRIHLSNWGWLGLLQRLLGSRRAPGCKCDWPLVFCWKSWNRLKRRISPPFPYFLLYIPSPWSPTQPYPLLSSAVFNLPVQTDSAPAAGLNHQINMWAAALVKHTGWPVTGRMLVPWAGRPVGGLHVNISINKELWNKALQPHPQILKVLQHKWSKITV